MEQTLSAQNHFEISGADFLAGVRTRGATFWREFVLGFVATMTVVQISLSGFPAF